MASGGESLPKPYIRVEDEPLWLWAARCLPLQQATKIVFVVLERHLAEARFRDEVAAKLSGLPVEVIGLEETTRGQLETALCAQQFLDLDAATLIFNADSWFVHDRSGFVRKLDDFDGVLGVVRAPGDQWSFVKLDSDGAVCDVAEKQRISDLACTGLYTFRDTRRFVLDAEEEIADADSHEREAYVAPLYKRMLERGSRLGIHLADDFASIGTPEELASFRRRAAALT